MSRYNFNNNYTPDRFYTYFKNGHKICCGWGDILYDELHL